MSTIQSPIAGGDGGNDDRTNEALPRYGNSPTAITLHTPPDRFDYRCAFNYLRLGHDGASMVARLCEKSTCPDCGWWLWRPTAIETAVEAGLTSRFVVAEGPNLDQRLKAIGQRLRRTGVKRRLPIRLGPDAGVALWHSGPGDVDRDLLESDLSAHFAARIEHPAWRPRLRGGGFTLGVREAIARNRGNSDTEEHVHDDEDCHLVWLPDVPRPKVTEALDRHGRILRPRPRRWDIPDEDTPAWMALEEEIGLHLSCDRGGRQRALALYAAAHHPVVGPLSAG